MLNEDQPQFTDPPELNNTPSVATSNPSNGLSWQASEYIHHEKGFGWYLIYILILVVALGGLFFFTRDWFASTAIGLVALAALFYAGRKPSVRDYTLSAEGLTVGSKQYALDAFKSFSPISEGNLPGAVLMPTQRFMPPIFIYFPPDMSQQILDTLSSNLAFEEHKPDIVDRILSNIRF